MPNDIEFVLPRVWPEWLTLLIGLAGLTVVLLAIGIRHGSLLDPIRRTLRYRVALAAIAGWLGTWCVLPFSFFPVPEAASGFFTPGALFGLLVLIPLLDDPAKHPVRAAVLIWAAAIAYAMLWFSGMAIVQGLETFAPSLLSDTDSMPPLLAPVVLPSIVGGPAGMAFGTIVGLTAWRVLGRGTGSRYWLRVLILGAVGGTAYAAMVLQSWATWIIAFEIYTFEDAELFLVHVLWYAGFALILSVRRPAPKPPVTTTDYLLLAGLVLLSVLVVASFGLERFPLW